MRRLALATALLMAALASPGARAAEPGPPPAPWQPPPRWLGAWLRAGPFLASGLPGARTAPELGMGLGLRLLPFLTLEAEGGWISRDLQGAGARNTLTSRAATLGARLHHLLGWLEPSAFAGLALLDNRLASDVSLGSTRSRGLALGGGLDLVLNETFSVGLEGRWLSGRSFARPGQPALSLDGMGLTAVARLYYP